MKPADKVFLDGLRKSVCDHIPQEHWDLVVKAVNDAGDIRDVTGYARTIILEGVEKGRFASRSEAGRYAANMRWQGQGQASAAGNSGAAADGERQPGDKFDMARVGGTALYLMSYGPGQIRRDPAGYHAMDRNNRSLFGSQAIEDAGRTASTPPKTLAEAKRLIERWDAGGQETLVQGEGKGFDSPKMKEQLAYEAKRDEALGAKAADIADAVSERDEPVAPKAGTPGPTFDSRSGFKGPKYQGYRKVTVVAQDVRRDLKDAVANGELPQGLKFSVKSDSRGTNAVRVRVSGTPRTRDENGRLTGEAKAIYEKVDSIVNAYNRDNSDIMTDYFDVDYYGTVQLDD
jgi:Arc/MetJ-type ribon-helix-helix transcriptional regulator